MKVKGKAIIGIAMAAIMLASVLAATTVVSGWVHPGLTAELSTSEVDPGDTFTVSGNATELEIEQVDIITLAPCSGRVKGMNGSAGTYINITPGYVTVPATIPGITYVTASVSEDDTFSKEIHVHPDAEPGNYVVIVLHPGRDGIYGCDIPNGSMLLPAISWGNATRLLSKTQAQLFAIIEDATWATAGSDDFEVTLEIKVAGTPCVSLDPIPVIEVGDPLRVTGSTCRGDAPILITVSGPDYTSQVVQPEGGKFEATFDTEGIPVGTYAVRAEDIEEGYCDETTVEVLSVVPEKTTVSVHTDKTSYTAGDTMRLGLDVTNLGDALPVRFAIWLEQPGGGMYVLTYTSVTLPAGCDYSNENFMVFTLPSIPEGTYTWNAAIIEPSGPIEFISHDTAVWEFVGREASIETEDITEVFPAITEIEFED